MKRACDVPVAVGPRIVASESNETDRDLYGPGFGGVVTVHNRPYFHFWPPVSWNNETGRDDFTTHCIHMSATDEDIGCSRLPEGLVDYDEYVVRGVAMTPFIDFYH